MKNTLDLKWLNDQIQETYNEQRRVTKKGGDQFSPLVMARIETKLNTLKQVKSKLK